MQEGEGGIGCQEGRTRCQEARKKGGHEVQKEGSGCQGARRLRRQGTRGGGQSVTLTEKEGELGFMRGEHCANVVDDKVP